MSRRSLTPWYRRDSLPGWETRPPAKRGTRTTLGIPGSGWSWRSPTTPFGKHQMPPPPLMAANRSPRPPAKRGHPVLMALACTVIVGLAIAAWQIITG
jgi:hypothetical protein